MAEKRPYWLDNVLARYDLRFQLWQTRGEQLDTLINTWQSNKHPPTPASADLPTALPQPWLPTRYRRTWGRIHTVVVDLLLREFTLSMNQPSSYAATAIESATLFAEAEALLTARCLAEATERFHEAEEAGADSARCAGGRWMASMLSGSFEQAWRESDVIRQQGAPDPHRFWQGEPLGGKRVILRCLHGFGDAVQFLRYVPHLRTLTSHLIVEVPPRFVELARCFEGVDEVITWGPQAPVDAPAWDVQMEIMELPYIFRTQVSDLPLATHYLRLPQSPARRSGTLQVGIAWTAGSWNTTRAIPFAALQLLLATKGCSFWNLQGGPEETLVETDVSLQEEPRCRESIEGLAATIAQLDLVVTVDTLAAHLAGALGVSAWVLLQHEADWRWMHDRGDSPWYPSLRLFRQSTLGDWAGVIASVCGALQARVLLGDRQVV